MKPKKTFCIKTLLAATALIVSQSVVAHSQVEPLEYLIDFKITGQLTGQTDDGLPI